MSEKKKRESWSRDTSLVVPLIRLRFVVDTILKHIQSNKDKKP